MFGLDKVATRIVVGLLAIAFLCLVAFVITYNSRGAALKASKAEATIAAGRTESAVDAIEVIAENTEAAAAVHADVKEAQDAIRQAPPADRERIARCRLRDLQGLPPC